MNIIILSIADLPLGDATSSRVKLIGRGLMEAGNRVKIVLLHASAIGSLVENEYISGTVEQVPYLYASGSTIRPDKLLPALKDTAKGIWNAVRILFREKRAGKADLVILYTPDLFRYAPIISLCKLLRIAIFVEACEIMSLNTYRMSSRQKIILSGSRFLEKMVALHAQGVIAITHHIASYYIRNGMNPNKTIVLPILVDGKNFTEEKGSVMAGLLGKQFFLYSGTFGEKDGILFILKAFAIFHEEYPDVILVMTGDSAGSPNRSRYEAVAKEMGLEECVCFTGFIPKENLIWCYQQALALLVCRTRSAFACAGFPTKLGEYLAIGRPVIATNVGDLKEYLSDGINSFLIFPESAETLYQAMKDVIRDGRRALVIGEAGRKVALDKFDYKKAGERLDLFLRYLLNRGTSS